MGLAPERGTIEGWRRGGVGREKIGVVKMRGMVRAGLVVGLCAVTLPAGAWAKSTKADEQAGAMLFREKGCAHCHGVGGAGGKKAPALTDLRKKKEWTEAKTTGQILNGGQKMPPFADSVTDAEVAQLVAYLRAKHRPAPPPGTEPGGAAAQ